MVFGNESVAYRRLVARPSSIATPQGSHSAASKNGLPILLFHQVAGLAPDGSTVHNWQRDAIVPAVGWNRYTDLQPIASLFESKVDAAAMETPPYFHPEQAPR
jgi:hypothetical protein